MTTDSSVIQFFPPISQSEVTLWLKLGKQSHSVLSSLTIKKKIIFYLI